MNLSRLLLVIIASYCSLCAQTTITLAVTEDAPIGFHDGAGTAGNNYGSGTQYAAFWIPSAVGSGFNGNRSLLKFDLSQIPSGVTIISAELNLYGLAPYGSLPGHTGSNNSAYIQRITQPWQEYSVTWNNQPTSTTVNQVTLGQSSFSGQNYLNIDVKNLVIDMISNSSTSHGFLLKLVSETASNAMIFASRDHSNSQMHPLLKITYGCATNVSFSSFPATICSGATASFFANTNSLNINWYNSPTAITPIATGSTYSAALNSNSSSPYVYTIYAENPYCANSKFPVTVTVNPIPNVTVAGTSYACCGSLIQLQGQGAASYEWPNGVMGPSYSFSTCTSVTLPVKGTNQYGCSSSIVHTLTLMPNPTISIVPVSNIVTVADNSSVCCGTQIELQGQGATSYHWPNGITGSNYTMSTCKSTVLPLKGTNQYGCSSTIFHTLTVMPSPNITVVPASQAICRGSTAVFNANGAVSYSWTANSQVISTTNQFSVTASQNSIFMLVGANAFNCKSTTVVSLIVNECTGLNNSEVSRLKIYGSVGCVHLQAEEVIEIGKLEIFEVTGKQIRQLNATGSAEFIVSDIPAGIYFARLTKGTHDVVIRKVIVH